MKLFNYICGKLKRMGDIYTLLTSQLSNQGSKTNVVRPLIYLLGLLLTVTIALFYHDKEVAGYYVMGSAGVVLLCLLGAYFFCLFKNPDLLRSEKFVLEKTAIERTAQIGDSNPVAKIAPPEREYVVYPQEENK